jgi:hypothetical protein
MAYVNRHLQNRSYLIFEYKGEQGMRHFSILPFFENIVITEDQKANLAVYDLVGRNGNMYAYTGAKSRQFKLTFKLNIPHIHDLLSQEGLTYSDFSHRLIDYDDKKSIRQAFLNPKSLQTNQERVSKESRLSQAQKAKTEYLSLQNPTVNITSEGIPLGSNLGLLPVNSTQLNLATLTALDAALGGRVKTFDLCMWWINLVRSSVTNNSSNTIYGPPIIRINHSLLYNNVPCICTNYSIKEFQNTSYDVITNTANIFEINMSLEEVRSSFGEYQPGDAYKGDNVTGWDGLKKYKTMDPYNGPTKVKNSDEFERLL